MGQPLTLNCEVTTVRGITSNLNIRWSCDGSVLQETNGILGIIEGNSKVFTDSYIIKQLKPADNGKVIQCEVVINAVGTKGSITLSGK